MTKLIPVIVTTLIIALLSDLFSTRDKKFNNGYVYKEKFLWFFAALAFAIFFGLRTRYNDTQTYLEGYIYIVSNTITFENFSWDFGDNPGFNLAQMIMKSSGVSPQGFLMIFSVITYFIYIWFIHKYTSDFFMSMVIFICMVMTFPAAAIKQTIAVAFCLIAVDRAIRKKWIAFIFWIFIAETFHAYSIMYLIVPLMFFIPWEGKKSYFWVAAFFIAGILLQPMLGTLIDVTSMMGDEYTAESFTGEGVNPFRLLVSLVPLILSFMLRKQINDPRYEITREDGICMNLSMLNGEIMFVALFGTANYFARLANYFYIFPVIAMPRLLNMITPKWRTPIKIAAVVCYFLFFYYESGILRPVDSLFNKIALSEFQFFI